MPGEKDAVRRQFSLSARRGSDGSVKGNAVQHKPDKPADADGDGVPDSRDNCLSVANPGQQNNDGDVHGDACDADDDNDGILDIKDNCDFVANPGQADSDNDGIGNACDPQTGPPTNANQCKNDGWKNFNFPRTFKNQGDCVSFTKNGK